MSNHDLERTLDAALEEQELGRVLQVLGWTILAMSSITCVWIWTGWRAGSFFWFWFSCGLGFLGSASIAASVHLKSRGAVAFGAAEAEIAKLAAAKREEAAPPEDLGRRAA